MRTFTLYRAPEGDGTSGGGGSTAAPVQLAETVQLQPSASAVEPQVKDVWGGRSAPEWAKAAGLGQVHIASNREAGTETPDETATETQPAVAAPAVTQQPAPAAGTASAPAAQPATIPPVQDPTAIATSVAEAVKRVMEQQQPAAQQPAPTLSQAEIAQKLGVFTATADDYEAAFGVKPTSATQLDAYNRHLQGVAKQAVAISQILTQRQFEAVQQQITPAVAAARQAEAERHKTTFFTANADLKAYEPLVQKAYESALARVRSGELRFKAPEEAYKFVAEETRAMLKAVGITPTAPGTGGVSTTKQSTTKVAPNPSSRTMTTTLVGGRSGQSAAGQQPNKIEQVWGKR